MVMERSILNIYICEFHIGIVFIIMIDKFRLIFNGGIVHIYYINIDNIISYCKWAIIVICSSPKIISPVTVCLIDKI